MNGPGLLTWYPGSLLPYASLWHTVHRAIALNRLQPQELPRRPGTAAVYRAQNLLFNEPDPIDTAALALWLGEPAQALHWSHLGAAAPWMRALFTPGLRICTACLCQGYHSALLSLRLLQTCPIHGTPLRQRCSCGRSFSPWLMARDFGSSGSCPCGALSFLTTESCRRPALQRAACAAFDPVVCWLQQWTEVVALRPAARARQFEDERAWLGAIVQWCKALGLEYPALFLQPSQESRHTLVVHRSGRTLASAADPTAARPAPGTSPTALVYRAMSRHLRRHVLRRLGVWSAAFEHSADPLHIAELLARQRPALLAFAALLWAREVECGTQERRWQRDSACRHARRELPEPLMPEAPLLRHDTQSAELLQRLDARSRHWLEYHAAGAVMAALWRHALSRATMAARAGLASWEANTCSISQLCSCMATIEADGGLRLACMSATEPGLCVQLKADKPQRRHAATECDARRRTALLDTCQGPCLTWSAREGWHVQASRHPGDGPCKRHRLLGIVQARPRFWLFTSRGEFVARHCTVAMQALGSTVREAIGALRAGVRHHACLWGAAAHGPRRSAPSVVPHRLRLHAYEEHRRRMRFYRDELGFWRASQAVVEAARQYLEEAARHSP